MKKGEEDMKLFKTESLRTNPCLDTLLLAVNGGKKDKMFLKKVKRDKDGNLIDCFTKKGAKIYNRLCDIIYGALVLTEVPNRDEIFAHIQDELDDIASTDEG